MPGVDGGSEPRSGRGALAASDVVPSIKRKVTQAAELRRLPQSTHAPCTDSQLFRRACSSASEGLGLSVAYK